MLDWLTDPFSYPFMQRALVEVLIVGVISGLIGCFVVLRGLAFIGDALAHAVFPGVVLSYLAGRSIVIGAFVFGAITAVAVGTLARSRRVSEDTAIGVLFAGMFAFGVVLISRNSQFRRDLGSLLFGNVLGVSWADIAVTATAGAFVVLIVAAVFKELQLIAFDTTMARTAGYPVFALDLLLLLLLTLTIVVSLQTVGNILMLALLVTPPAAARLLTDRFGRMIAWSIGIGVFSGAGGLLVSYHLDTAAGGTIVLFATAIFVLAWLFAPTHGILAARFQRERHHVHHYHGMDEGVEPS